MRDMGNAGMSVAERDAAVTRILEDALPARRNPIDRLREVARSITPGMLMFGVGDCVFTAALSALLVLAPAAWAAQDPEQIAVALFAASPVFYALVQALCTWKDVESGTMAWRSVCRVTPCEIGALRMLTFGAVAVAVCVPVAAFVWLASSRAASFGWMLSVACASLFTFASFTLALMRALSRVQVGGEGLPRRLGLALPLAAPMTLWLAACAAMASLPEFGRAVLGVPAVVFAGIALAAAAVFVAQVVRGVRLAAPPSQFA